MIERAGYIPDIVGLTPEYETLTFHTGSKHLEVKVPLLSLEQQSELVKQVRHHSCSILKQLKVTEIVEIISDVIEQLLDRTNPYRQKAEELLPIVTGYDEKMIRLGLTSYLKTFRQHELLRFF